MAPVVHGMIREELNDRRHRLEEAVLSVGESPELARLLDEVDAALGRLKDGSYGLCDVCKDPIEPDRLIADPLARLCLDHLTSSEQRALEADLELAARIQMGLLPPSSLTHGGWEVAYHYEPLGPVSGDYIDLLPQADGRLFFALGDASGKGVAASMLMAQLNAMFRTLIAVNLPLDQMLAQASRVFCESTLPTHYATLICGWANLTGEIEFCNAGHPPPVLVRREGAGEVKGAGLPIGLFCQESFPLTCLRLGPGESLLLYSDGLSEAGDPSGDEFGRERVAALAAPCHAMAPQELVATCVRGARLHMRGAAKTDDLSVMALRRSPS